MYRRFGSEQSGLYHLQPPPPPPPHVKTRDMASIWLVALLPANEKPRFLFG